MFIISLIVMSIFNVDNTGSAFVYENYLNKAVANTVIIGISVVIITTFISVPLAIINIYYNYKFKTLIHIFTFLPMTIPCYILAYQYNSLLSYGGELSFLSLSISSLFGAVIIYSLSFFPYSYMLVRSSLKKVPFNIIETAIIIDSNFFKTSLKIIVPIVSKSIFAAAILILGEVFSDIGVVEYFNVQTVSTIIKSTYIINNNYGLAIQLGLKFGGFMIFLLVLESLLFPKIQYTTSKQKAVKVRNLHKLSKALYYICFVVLIAVSFIIPVTFMIKWVFNSFAFYDLHLYFSALFNTIKILVFVIITILVVGVLISHITVFNKYLRSIYTIFNMWYVLPSILIGLMLTTYFMAINNIFNTTIISSITIVILFIAYVIKYLPIAINMITKSYLQINKGIIESAVVMKSNRFKTFLDIDLKLLRPALITSTVVLVTDIVKELTLTYTLRPFNFETLSTMTALYARDEMIHESSLYSLTIIVICVIAVLILTRKEFKK